MNNSLKCAGGLPTALSPPGRLLPDTVRKMGWI